MGDEGKAVGSAQAPAALLSQAFRQALWPRWAESDQGFRNVRFGSKADIETVQLNVRFTPKSGH
jgi:hypothetical protein